MAKLGKGVHTDESGTRAFVSPDVPVYDREDGGKVIVLEPLETEIESDTRDPGDSEQSE